MPNPLAVAQTEAPPAATLALLPEMANRHGLVAGATGTGKTVTLQVLAEALSRSASPSSPPTSKATCPASPSPAVPTAKLKQRCQRLQLSGFQLHPRPVTLWDVFGPQGHPIRATISEMGPVLLARMLALNDIQSGVLNLVFRIADDNGLLLLDLKDLNATLQYVAATPPSSPPVRQHLQPLHRRHPARPHHPLHPGRRQLLRRARPRHRRPPPHRPRHRPRRRQPPRRRPPHPGPPALLHLPPLAPLRAFRAPPRSRRPPPAQARLLLRRSPPPLLRQHPRLSRQRIEQVVRLIRSKGVGVFFVTQNPTDLPDTVLSQLGNRVQHALRAFTPRRPESRPRRRRHLPPQPAFDTATAITQLARRRSPRLPPRPARNVPGIVDRALICPPASRNRPRHPRAAPATPGRSSVVAGKYDTPIDRDQRLRTPHPTRPIPTHHLHQPHLATPHCLAAPSRHRPGCPTFAAG